MSKIARFAVLLAALMSLFGVLSTTAGAVTWHNTGDTALTAASPTPSTLSVTGVNLTCTGGDAVGTSPAGSVAGATYTGISGTMSFTGCSLSGLPTTLRCTAAVLLAAAAFGPEFAVFVGLVCVIEQFGTEICKVEGQTAGVYRNPSGTTGGKLTLNHSSSLRTTNGTGGSCPLGVNEPLTLTTQAFTVTSGTGGPTPHLGPKITRTA